MLPRYPRQAYGRQMEISRINRLETSQAAHLPPASGGCALKCLGEGITKADVTTFLTGRLSAEVLDL